MQRELTGVPPLTFVSNGENLVDYRIYGASGGVGDRMRNLFSGRLESGGFLFASGEDYLINTRVRTTYIEVQPDTSYTIQCTGGYVYGVGFYTNNSYIGYEQPTPPSSLYVFKTRERSQRIRISFCSKYGDNTQIGIADIESVQLEKGSIATTYEPYGYKIPIVCGGTTTNIYLNEPLGENESISMSDTGLLIPTINGSNTLSVNTTVQPSSVYVKYATNKRSVPARTYLQGVEKMDNWAIYNYINREGSGALKNESTVTSTTVEVRNTIQVTGAASGGTGSYQYAFYHKRSNAENWTTKSDYGAATTVEFSPYYVDTYKFKVNVKDSKGTIKSKIFNINVTAAASTTSNMPSLDKLSFENTDEPTVESDFNRADLTVEDNTPEEV